MIGVAKCGSTLDRNFFGVFLRATATDPIFLCPSFRMVALDHIMLLRQAHGPLAAIRACICWSRFELLFKCSYAFLKRSDTLSQPPQISRGPFDPIKSFFASMSFNRRHHG